MKTRFPAFAKRALAFALTLVLLLSLCPILPLTANAAYTTDGWVFYGTYSTWMEGRFHTSDSDLIYENNQSYDWYASIYQNKSEVTASVTATIQDANGNVIDSYTNNNVVVAKGDSTMVRASDFTKLTTDLFGTFTLVCDVDYKGDVATLTKTFKRVSSSTIESTVTSRSNPDKVFTFADPIDLVLNIKKNDGVATAYNAAVTVTNASGTELLAARGLPLSASTNTVLSVKDLVNLPSIKTAGEYKVNLTLTDSSGAVKHQASFPFYVVALTGNLNATITSATSTNLTFNNTVPDLVVNLTKNDGIAETLTTAVTVTDGTSSVKYSDTFETTTATATVTPDLSGLATTGTFTMNAVVTDDAGNQRATASVTFTRTNVNITPATYSITSAPKSVTGSIYSNTTGSDFSVSIRITNQSIRGSKVYIKAVGTLNGQPFMSPALEKTLSAYSGTVTAAFTGTNLGSYGIFEDISLAVYDANGNQLCQTTEAYSFARVLDTSTPGGLPILNINDHFTDGKGDYDKKLTLAAQTGANMWRASIPWASVEGTKGVYEMPGDVALVMNKTKSVGMQAFVILAYGNDGIYGTPNPDDATWLQAYVNYCTYVAKYMHDNYPNQVVGFEIWNEWNHASMSKVPATYRTGAYYAKVVVAASAAIKKVFPNAKIIGGATAGDGYGVSNSNTFIHAMLAADGFLDAVDGISFHTYSSMETTTSRDNPRRFEYVSPATHDFAARIGNFHNILSQYGASGKEVWITETGWTTNEVPEDTTNTSDGKRHITTGATEQEAAAYLVQLYTWALANGTVDRIFWYDFMNDISNQTKIWANNQTESNYGLIHNWNNTGDQPKAYSAKAGYATMCAFASKMSGTTDGTTISLGSGIFAYQFKKGSNYITVVWTDGSTKTLTANLSKSITVTDMYGNATTYSGSSAVLNLSEAPIYIEYASGAISSFS